MSVDHNPALAEWRESVCAWLFERRDQLVTGQAIIEAIPLPKTTLSFGEAMAPAVRCGTLACAGTGLAALYAHTGRPLAAPRRPGAAVKPFAAMEARTVGRYPSVFHFGQGITA